MLSTSVLPRANYPQVFEASCKPEHEVALHFLRAAEGTGAGVKALADEDVQRALHIAAVELTGHKEQTFPQQLTQPATKLGSPLLSFDPHSSAMLDTHAADWVGEAYNSFYSLQAAELASSSGSSNAAFLPNRAGGSSGRQTSFRHTGVPAESSFWRHDLRLMRDDRAFSTAAATHSLQNPAESVSSHASARSIISKATASTASVAASASLLQGIAQPQQLSGLPNDFMGGLLDLVLPQSSTGTEYVYAQGLAQVGDASSEQQASAVPQVACSGLGRVQPVVSAGQTSQFPFNSVMELPVPCSAAPEPRTLTHQDIPLTGASPPAVSPTAASFPGIAAPSDAAFIKMSP
ncbi:hypothetical protein WJX74_004032 [Apatococcus lobatus]|uniref:Uncharacterized protein n=1 Tax=Apatococcus lobatus TaxID=904363 RepID=A0AAW1RWI4_9CHLO